MAKYWDFRGSNVEEWEQQMRTSDRKLQNNGSDAGTYFLYRNGCNKGFKINEIKCSIYIVLYNTMPLQGFVPSVLKLSTVPLMMMLL